MEALNNFFLPPAKTAAAEQYDTLFWFVHISSFVLTAGIVIAVIYFCVKYRRKSENDVAPVITGDRRLEVLWSVIPLLLTLVCFGWGYQTYLQMTAAPDDAYEIRVTGQQWLWRFEYKNGVTTTGELHVPTGRPVKLVMQSADVIHDFYIPAFRIKQDVVPGRYVEEWFNVRQADTSQVFCAEYCGNGHSKMLAKIIAQKPEDFKEWLASSSGPAKKPAGLNPVEWGKQLAQQQTCATCHSVDGSRMTGPSWKGIYGEEQQLADGSTVKVDDIYIRESIEAPKNKVVKGFDPVMPSFKGQLNDDQIDAITQYIKSLK